MKKSIQNLITEISQTDSGLAGGFGFVRGGRDRELPGANGAGCNNDGICSSTNNRDCTNSGHCDATTNVDVCTNTSCLN